MKLQARVLAVDDSPFVKGIDEYTFLIGALFRGLVLEKVLKARIEVDGDDAEDKIVNMVLSLKGEVRLLFLHGTTFGGFNTVRIDRIHDSVGIPVISFLETPPDRDRVMMAMSRMGRRDKIGDFLSQQEFLKFNTKHGPLYCSFVGLDEAEVARLIENFSVESKMPEQLRIADVFASVL